MKWREVRNKTKWYNGPPEGRVRYLARRNGKSYSVGAAWRDWLDTSKDIAWWSHDGIGNNNPWKTKEAAQAWCEQDAAKPKEVT